jgi:plastocyanin
MLKKALLLFLQASYGLALLADNQVDVPLIAGDIAEIISIGAPQQGYDTATHHISVGGDSGLQFVPNRVNANIGDRITFQFHTGNHTLTQSSLEKPCVSSEQLDSGFNQFNPGGEEDLILTFTVNTLAPQWFFCRQNRPGSHCHAGMVFAVNPGNLMEEFLSNAIPQASSTVVVTETKTVTSIPSPSASVFASIKPILARSTGFVKAPTNSVSSAPKFKSGAGRLMFVWSLLLLPLFAMSTFMCLM